MYGSDRMRAPSSASTFNVSNVSTGEMPETEVIIQAVRDGDYATINKLMVSGQSLMNIREPGTGASLAHVAARDTDKAILKLLIRKYSEYIRMSNNQGRTLVHEAAEHGTFVCLTYLLQHGASSRTRDRAGLTPLMLSAQKGHLQCLRRLALSDPEIMNTKDNTGLTALHHGSAAGHLDIVRWLVEFGADDQQRDPEGGSALHWAVQSNHLKCSLWLQQNSGCDVRHINNLGYNSCHIASQLGHHEILRWLLINKLVSPDEPGCKDGSTPVHEAAAHGQVECLRLLRQHGANMHKRNFNDKIPKDIAVQNKHAQCVKFLEGIKKPKADKSMKRANSLTRFVQALNISGDSEKQAKKSKRRIKSDFEKNLSDTEDSMTPEKLNFKERRSRAGSFNSSMRDERNSVYSNGSGGDRRSGASRWETATRNSPGIPCAQSPCAQSPSSTKFDIMEVLRQEKHRQQRLQRSEEDDTMSVRSSGSAPLMRSHRFYGSQDTMDRNSVGSPLASPFGYVPSPPPRSGDVGSPFGYVPSPPPRGTSMDAARASLSSAELFDGVTSPGIENASDRSSLALSDDSGESRFTRPPCPVHKPASPSRMNQAKDFKQIFNDRQNARMNARCTCRNSGNSDSLRSETLRNNSWTEAATLSRPDQLRLNEPRPLAEPRTLRRQDINKELDNFKQNWGTKTLIQPCRSPHVRAMDYDPDFLSCLPASPVSEPQTYYVMEDQTRFPDCGKSHRSTDTTFRTSTNLSDICKL